MGVLLSGGYKGAKQGDEQIHKSCEFVKRNIESLLFALKKIIAYYSFKI